MRGEGADKAGVLGGGVEPEQAWQARAQLRVPPLCQGGAALAFCWFEYIR